MSTDPSALPDFNGRPVPWITRWTGELDPERFEYGAEVNRDGQWRITYPDNKNVRDRRGILWQREGIGRKGEPMWADVSTYRQRAAMQRGLCQVCGKDAGPPPWHFLIPRDGMEQFDDQTWLTMQAPVCDGCVPLAIKLCPALKRVGYQLLKVVDYDLWGVLGQVTYRDEKGRFNRFQSAVSFDTRDYGEFRLGHILAQQLVVSFDKFVIEESVTGRSQASTQSWSELLHPETTLNPSVGQVQNALTERLR